MQRSAKRKKRNKSWPICSIKAPKVTKRRSSSITTWLLLCDKEGRGVKLEKDLAKLRRTTKCWRLLKLGWRQTSKNWPTPSNLKERERWTSTRSPTPWEWFDRARMWPKTSIWLTTPGTKGSKWIERLPNPFHQRVCTKQSGMINLLVKEPPQLLFKDTIGSSIETNLKITRLFSTSYHSKTSRSSAVKIANQHH